MPESSTPATTGAPTTTTYKIDPAHTLVEFAVKHMMFTTVKGRFPEVDGQIEFDENDPTRSSVSATIGAASVDTRESKRDEHLRSPDFFDVATFPTLRFVSRAIEPRADGEGYRIVGDLTIRDATREVALDTTFEGKGIDPWGAPRVGFSATTTINRKDYGLNYNAVLESGGVLVGDQIKISLEVEAVKQG